VVFTDLDGTLLDHETYSNAPATEALDLLAERRIPVILCSSKTRAEIELIRLNLRLSDPFISENGGAVFLPRGYFPFAVPDTRNREGYDAIEFGAPYWKLVDALHEVATQLGIKVVGFSDMSIEELAQDCGLSPLEARLAKMREYDEAFRILDAGPAVQSRLFNGLHKLGLRCTRGGRYHHVTGVADKGQAVRRLKALYKENWGSVTTIGLGDSLNDLSLLQAVDVPIVVRNPATHTSARLLRKVPLARQTSLPGPRGWNEAVLKVLFNKAEESP
jgi:mannosyl-3-phosphoglycerate phosphatase